MKKLIMALLVISMIVAMVTPAFARWEPVPYSPYRIWVPDDGESGAGDDDEDDGDDDGDDDNDNDDNKGTSDRSDRPAVTFRMTADANEIANLLNVIGAKDAILVIRASVDSALKGQGNVGTFADEALKTADGKEPAVLPFILYKVVGNEFIELKYKTDYIVDWATGTITIYNISDDCTYVFVPVA